MHHDFIKIKNLQGELILCHRRGQLATTITTKEMILQKPHQTYHILFEDILSIIPYQLTKRQTVFNVHDELQVFSSFSHQLYKVEARELVIMNRYGRFLRQHAELILPLSEKFLEKVQQYTDLTYIPV
jgi:hypothetical protein